MVTLFSAAQPARSARRRITKSRGIRWGTIISIFEKPGRADRKREWIFKYAVYGLARVTLLISRANADVTVISEHCPGNRTGGNVDGRPFDGCRGWGVVRDTARIETPLGLQAGRPARSKAGKKAARASM